MKSIFIILLLLTSCISFSQETITDKRLTSLDTAFERALKTWKTAGFAVAVVEKNKIIYAKGFGFRDVEKKIPVTPSTLLQLEVVLRHSLLLSLAFYKKMASLT